MSNAKAAAGTRAARKIGPRTQLRQPNQPVADIVARGLPKAARPARVLVLGAGMAGLAAAYELLRAGHDPVLLEARPRVGGRIYTLRDPFAHGLHAEVGAMRIPAAHDLTLAYVRRFNLSTLPFTMGNPKAYYHVGGVRRRIGEADPDQLGFELHPHERGRTYAELWAAAITPLLERLAKDGPQAWNWIVENYDDLSTREFLEANGWSEGAIEMFGLFANQEALMNASFLELFREEAGRFYEDMVQIAGGMDLLPRAFLPDLAPRIRFGARIAALEQDADGVRIHYRNGNRRHTERGDYAVVSLPFAVLRHIEVLPPFTRAKQRAIRQLHYDASAKILFQCRRRFWETDDGIYGGGSVTDLPIRNVYYPEQGRESGRGVVLASYTWSEDAQRWGSLSPQDRIAEAIEQLAHIHPQILEEFETGTSWMWHDDEFAGGAFALFDPGQQTLLHEAIVAPEGRFHFAGEHASLAHAWIQGSIESGLRAAKEVAERAAAAA
ncbi:MAG: FAD-dependent oxidoreductase [Rhodospirillaceae bacterium]|nr:FAD-dependent oxidoreductase [Rhodospirillaceae bacterium]